VVTPPMPRKQFVSESIEPVAGSFITKATAGGEPALPLRFVWRGATYEVAQVLSAWKATGPSKESVRERYLRKHWFRVLTTTGAEMEIYFERQARGRQIRQRWWLATIIEPEEATPQRP
jgi:hypothetical protein